MHADGLFAHNGTHKQVSTSGVDLFRGAVNRVLGSSEKSGADTPAKPGKGQSFFKRLFMCGRPRTTQEDRKGAPNTSDLTAIATTLKAQAEAAKAVYLDAAKAAKASPLSFGDGSELDGAMRDIRDTDRACMPQRWMLLPFEAATALRDGADLTWQGSGGAENGRAKGGIGMRARGVSP
jgi:hypothetical protein